MFPPILKFLSRLHTRNASRIAACGLVFSLWSAATVSAQSGTGLTGQYFDTGTFTSLMTTRTDAGVNFNWGSIPSGTALTHADTFSVIWTGQIEPEFTENYTFLVTADDAATLWINDQVVCHRSKYQTGNPPIIGQIRLEAGKRVNIRLEYVENTNTAAVSLEWQSTSRPREFVPAARLYPARVAKAGGSLLKEHWSGITGTLISSLTSNANYPNKPGGREFVTSFECLAQDWAENYGTRVTGFIVPPVSGSYSFAVSGDDTAELWLSTDATTTNKSLVASVAAATGFRQWDLNPATQQSAARTLVRGERYYVELLHKEGTGTDHWSVGWKKPGEGAFSVVPGTALVQAGLTRTQPAQAAIFDTIARDHPRLYATGESFARLRGIWQSTTPSTAKSWATTIIAQADAVIPTASVTYPMNVDSARVVMNNMYKLGLAWQLTGDSKYPERAWTELNAVGAFADWFPSNREFLVTSECTHGFAIAYDWMYAYWTQARRDTIRTALINKGLNVGLSSYKSNFWALRSNCSSANWAIVCNSGLVSGALAVGTESETLCEDILTRAMNSLRGNFKRFTTDQGAIHEGFTYLEYAQRYAVRGLAGMEWVLGSDFGLSATQAMSETASVPIYFGGPSGVTFCASDDAESPLRRGWLWPWSARRYNQPIHNAWNNTNASPIALDALWQVDGGLTPAAAGASPDMACKGEVNTGFLPQEYFTLRTRWGDSRSTFVAAKAGEILTSHGHYDIGTFCLDALGKHWFSDLGKELYSTPAAREDLYRYRAEGHNTLVISPGTDAGNVNPSLSPLIAYQGKTSAAGGFGIHDLTAAHAGMSRVWRGIRMIGNRDEVLIQDEMVSATAKTAWWFAHFPSNLTTATLGADGTSVTLTQGTERLWCKIVSGGTFQIMDAAPLPSSPNPGVQSVNSNHKKLAINLTNVTNTTLAVWFVPLETGENPPATLPAITPLNTWTIDNSNFPPVASGSSVTSVNNQPVDVDLSTLAEDDNTPATALTFALSNVQGGTASLLPDGRSARFTPTPGAGGTAGFDFTATDSSGLGSNVATVTVGASPVIYTWTALTSGNWSANANWLANTPATSYRGAEVRFLTGQTLSNGTTLTATNDLPGTTRMNSLSFNGGLTAGSSVTVNLSGNPLQLGMNGPVFPTMALSGPTSGFTYNVNHNLELAADTTFNGANSGRVNFNGILSGSGGFNRSGLYGDVYFANNNTYQGPTVISSRGLTVGLFGSTSTVGSLGSGDVTTSGPITFQRANSYNVTNKISGGGGIIQFGTGTLTLNPQNTYTGSTQIYAGILAASSLNSVNGGEPPFESSSLGAPTTVAAGTIGLASGAAATLRYTGQGETTDRVVNLRSTASGTIEQAGTGLLKFTGNFTATGASTKTLTLTGSTTGTGELAGAVVDNSTTNKTHLAKTGTGTWTLSGSSSYTGTTAVSNGTLVVNGDIASPSLLTISSGARLSGSGSIASPVTVTGTLAPGDPFGALGIGGGTSFGAASRLTWESGANHMLSADQLNTAAISVTSGAKIDVTLNSPGSIVNFLHSFWRSARSFPVIVGTSMTGAFSLGTISADAGSRPAATYGSFSLQHTGTGVNLLWTPLPGLPGIDDPTLTLIQPTGDVVSLVNSALKLRVAVTTASSGAGTSIVWSEVSGPGAVTFAAPSAADTFASFSAAGTYLLRCTISNPVGVVFKDFTVHVAVPTTLTLREGVADYSHQCTFIRGDGDTWNSGASDQFIVGRGSSYFRGLLSFDIPEFTPGSTVENATLDLWVSESGTGSTALGTLELRQLLTTFLEGTGDGSTATNGTGTGADWTTRTGDSADSWSTPGGASGVDYASAVLASANGFIPTNTAVGTKVTLANATSAMKAAVASAAGGTEPLGFYFTSGDTTGANVYGRFASNDHATLTWRPLLTIQTSNHPAPDVNPGSAPAASAGAFVALGGSATNALSARWSFVSGPGQVWFGNTASVTSTVKFSAPGSYVLRLSAANANGEAARDLAVTVTGTAMSAIEIWRQTYFGNQANTGIGADSSDANNDGETNLLEFATGQDPYAATRTQTTLVKTATALEFTYTRSEAAFLSGYLFDVQYADTLVPPWTSVGPGDIMIPGPLQSVTATIPTGPAGSRFIRLKVTSP